MLKLYLQQEEGIVCNSLKRCFRELLGTGLVSADGVELFLMMTDDRNLTAHTYIEALAEVIYQKLPDYLVRMKRLLVDIEARVDLYESKDKDSDSQ